MRMMERVLEALSIHHGLLAPMALSTGVFGYPHPLEPLARSVLEDLGSADR